MYDENIGYDTDDFSTEDKVRLILVKTFSSNLFLWISLLYTITFVVGIISNVIEGFGFESVINLIIPLLMLIGVWKTYNMAKGGKHIDTSGLRLIRGIMTFLLVLFGFITGLLLLFSILGGLILIIVAIPLVAICYAYYSFRTTIVNIISSFEEGNSNTDYYTATMVFLGITIFFTMLANVFLYTFNPSMIPNVTPDLIEQFQYTQNEFIMAMINSGVSLISTALIFSLVYKLKKDLEGIHMYYGYKDVDFKISKNVIDSDEEIDDKRKYDV